MHKFKITYMDLQGNKTSSDIFADTQEEAIQRLFGAKSIVSIKDRGKVIEPPAFLKNVLRLEKLSPRELADILRLLAYTKKAGLSTTNSFESLVSTGSRRQILFCSRVLEALKAGNSLAEAIQQVEYMLPLKISGIIKSSSDSGNLYDVLLSLSNQLESNVTTSNNIRTAMIYPMLVLIIAIAVTVFLFSSIIPEIAGVLKNLSNDDLPATTQLILDIGQFFQHYGVVILIGIITFCLIIRIGFNKQYLSVKAKLAATAPLIRKVIVPGEMSKFYSHFAFLLKAGFPVDTALLSASNVLNNSYLQKCILKSHDAISRGYSISEAMRVSGIVNVVNLQLLHTGAGSGRLIDVCETISQQLLDETDRNITRLLKILEPAIMLIVGGIVGIIMIAVYQPLFEMMTIV